MVLIYGSSRVNSISFLVFGCLNDNLQAKSCRGGLKSGKLELLYFRSPNMGQPAFANWTRI